jgi:propanol-preferring alcohol dehydrogenase
MFCQQRITLGHHSHGTDAERVAVPAESCLPLSDELEPLHGALLACNFGTAYSGVRKLRVQSSETVAVFGLGPVGCCVTMVAARQGARVIGIDPAAHRRALAESFGACQTIDPSAIDPVLALRELTDGLGPQVAIDCSAFAPAQAQAMEAVAPTGRFLFLGVNTRSEINPGMHVIRKELQVFGSWVFKPAEYDEMVSWLIRARLPLDRLVTHRFAGSQAEEAFKLADSGAAGKVLIEWSAA